MARRDPNEKRIYHVAVSGEPDVFTFTKNVAARRLAARYELLGRHTQIWIEFFDAEGNSRGWTAQMTNESWTRWMSAKLADSSGPGDPFGPPPRTSDV